MELVLEITSSEQFLLGQNATKRFFPVGGVIGRSQGCDWVIPDQSRHLSGRHAQVSAEGEDFYITDISTNGVFLNGATNPIEKNKPHKLRSEDKLVMGDIQFKAVIHLDATRNGFTPTASAAMAASIGGFPEVASAGGAGAEVGGAETVEQILDPMELLRQKMPHVDEENPIANVSMANNNQLDQWHDGSVSMPDGLAAVQETFDAPAMRSERLPEDWYAVDLSAPVQSEELPSQRPVPRPGNRTSHTPTSSGLPVDPFQAPIDIPQTGIHSALDSYEQHTPVSGPPPVSIPTSPHRGELPTEQTHIDEHVAAFCQGLGVSKKDLAAVDSLQLMEQAGLALKETFAGMVHVMKGRASLKNEFRMDMTLVQMEKNNPFKFAADENLVLNYFLNADNDSFLTIPNALRESFTDIQEHQIGVMAAVQASLTQLLGKLDPERLEQRFDRGQAKGFSISGKRARYWEAYKEYHADIQQEESTFSSVFGDTFATTYKDQVERLKAAKSQHDKKQQEVSSESASSEHLPQIVDVAER